MNERLYLSVSSIYTFYTYMQYIHKNTSTQRNQFRGHVTFVQLAGDDDFVQRSEATIKPCIIYVIHVTYSFKQVVGLSHGLVLCVTHLHHVAIKAVPSYWANRYSDYK